MLRLPRSAKGAPRPGRKQKLGRAALPEPRPGGSGCRVPQQPLPPGRGSGGCRPAESCFIEIGTNMSHTRRPLGSSSVAGLGFAEQLDGFSALSFVRKPVRALDSLDELVDP